MFRRSELTNWDYINYLKGQYRNLAMKNPKLGGKGMTDAERRSIRGAADGFYLLHHINDIPFNDDGQFLDTDETIRLRELFDNRCRLL